MEQERRRTPRYTFAGAIEMRHGTSEDKITAKVRELSLNAVRGNGKCLSGGDQRWE